jgi:hypothetical protein
MRALTILQPWCDAITRGDKRVENRSWAPDGWTPNMPVALHAGKRFDWGAVFPPGKTALWSAPEDVALGAVLAVAKIAGFHWCNTYSGDGCSAAEPCSPWGAEGQYHWALADVRPLAEPVPCRGYQRLWPLPDDTEKAVRAQLGSDHG